MAEAPPKRKPKGFFVRGLGVVLPAVLTIFVFVTVFDFVRGSVARPINRLIYAGLESNGLGWSVLRLVDVDPYAPEYLLDPQTDDAILALANAHEAANDVPLLENQAFLTALEGHRAENATWIRDHAALGIDAVRLREYTREEVGVWVGVLIAAVGVLFVGYLASGFLGRSSIAAMHRLGARVPVVRSVYPYTKQLVDFFLAESELDFDTVVAAPYPSKGLWSIGFVTGTGLRTLNEKLEAPHLSVYFPTSPLPMTGFTVFMDAAGLVPLELSVEEALRVVVTAGVVVPASESVEGLQEPMARLGAFPAATAGGGSGGAGAVSLFTPESVPGRTIQGFDVKRRGKLTYYTRAGEDSPVLSPIVTELQPDGDLRIYLSGLTGGERRLLEEAAEIKWSRPLQLVSFQQSLLQRVKPFLTRAPATGPLPPLPTKFEGRVVGPPLIGHPLWTAVRGAVGVRCHHAPCKSRHAPSQCGPGRQRGLGPRIPEIQDQVQRGRQWPRRCARSARARVRVRRGDRRALGGRLSCRQ